MDDTFILVVIIIAIGYIIFTMHQRDYFSVGLANNTVHHLPYNHIEPPNIYNLGRGRDRVRSRDNDTLTLNDIDDIIHNYENINHNYNKEEIKRNNVINRNHQYDIGNRNNNKYRSCNNQIDEIKEVYINDERRNNRNKYANFKDKVYRNGVAYTSVDKLAAIRSDPYNNDVGKIGDAISSVYDNLLSTTYDKENN
jgi:hypothetical protein